MAGNDRIRAAVKEFLEKYDQCCADCEEAFLARGENPRTATLIDAEADQVRAHMVTARRRLTEAGAAPEMLAILEDLETAFRGRYIVAQKEKDPESASKWGAVMTLASDKLRDAAEAPVEPFAKCHDDDLPRREPQVSFDTLTRLASEIGGLALEPNAFARFQQMIVAWRDEWRRRRDAEIEFDRRRDEHGRRVRQDQRLQNEAGGPPHAGWLFEAFAARRGEDGAVASPRVIGGWVPPELSLAERPGARFPLPLPDGELTLPEKYAAVAAVYDYSSRGATKFDPWKGSADALDGSAYSELVKAVPTIPASDEQHLRLILDEIRRDLADAAQRVTTPIAELVDFCRPIGTRLEPIGFGWNVSPTERHEQAGTVMDEFLGLATRVNAAYANRRDSEYIFRCVGTLRDRMSELVQITAEPYEERAGSKAAEKNGRWMRALFAVKEAWIELDSLRDVPPGYDDHTERNSAAPLTTVNTIVQLSVESRTVEPADTAQPCTETKRTKNRMKREVAEPLIAQHLMARPHDTAEQVSNEVGGSVGVVAESKAWKLNQKRLKLAKAERIDPKAIPLNERAINAAGGDKMAQLHESRRQQDEAIDDIDAREQELFQRIGDFERANPGASPEETAKAMGCTAGDVERRQMMLTRLVKEQTESALEEQVVEDETAKGGKRQKWVKKQP
jgi:hypothetical protein